MPSVKARSAVAGSNGLWRRDDRLDAPERVAHGLDQRERLGGRPHAVWRAGQDLVAEKVARSRLSVWLIADCPMPIANRRPGDVALVEQRVERDQQVQIEPREIIVVDSHYEQSSFDS